MRLENQIYLPGKIEYPTTDGRKIQFTEEFIFRYQFELSICHYDEDEDLPTDIIEHRIWIGDTEGQLWTTATRFSANYLIEELAGANFNQVRQLSYFDEGDRETRSLFDSTLVLEGVRCSSDDRFYRSLWLGGERVEFIFKYTMMTFDIAAVEDLAFGTRLYGKLREESLWIEGEPLPAILFEMGNPDRFFLANTATYNQEEGYWEDSPLPFPIIFAPSDRRGDPQPNVIVS